MNHWYRLARSHITFVLTLLLVVHCSTPLVALCQEPFIPRDTLQTYILDAIVVTADRMANKVSNTTSSVTVLNAQDIQQLPAAKFSDVIASIPGFFFFSKDGLGRDAIVGTRGFYGGGEAEYVQILFDGIEMNDLETGLVNWNLIPLQSVSSVEVMRGSSSSLYGDAALGAVISIETGKDHAKRRSFRLSGGTYGSVDARLDLRGSLSTSPYRVFFSDERTAGFRDHSEYRSRTVGGDLEVPAGESSKFRITALGQWGMLDEAGPLTQDEVNQSREASSAYYKSDGRDERRYHAHANFSHNVSASSVFSASVFLKQKNTNRTRTFVSPALIIDPRTGSILGPYDTTLYGDTKERELRTTETGLGLQLTSSQEIGSMQNRFLVGFEGIYGSLRSTYYDQFHGFGHDYETNEFSRSSMVADGNGIRRKFAAYMNDELRVIEPLAIVLGARFDAITDSYTGTPKDTSLSAGHSLLSPKFGLNFRYIDAPHYTGNIYAAINGSFKAATIDQLTDQRPTDAGIFIPVGGNSYVFSPMTVSSFSNPVLRPQRAVSYEVGLYQRFRLIQQFPGELALSFYQIDVKDEIDFDLGTLKYQNIQESRHRGSELGMRLYWLTNATAFLNYTWTGVTFRSGAHTGNYLKAIPRNVVALGATYHHPMGLTASVMWNFINDMYLDDENTTLLPSYNTGNVKLSYGISSATFSVVVDNLLERRYSSTGYMLYGRTFLYTSVGRTIYGGVELEF